MSGPPNSEFARIFELLNAFEQLDEQEQSAVLEAATPANQPPGPAAVSGGTTVGSRASRASGLF